MSKKEIIETKLSVLNPHFLKITDQSHLHAGHVGNPDGNQESHFAVEISSDALRGISLIKQHRLINNLLKEEFDSGLHALSIKIKN